MEKQDALNAWRKQELRSRKDDYMNEKVFEIIELADDLRNCEGITSVSVKITSNQHVKVLEVLLETERDARRHQVYLNEERYGESPEQNLEKLYDLLTGIINGSISNLEMISGSSGYQRNRLFA